MSAHPTAPAIMSPLDRMETLSRRLALHHRILGDALDEASEIPAAANLDAVKDGLDVWVLQQEQLRELDQLVQDAFAAVREEPEARPMARVVHRSVAIVAGADVATSDVNLGAEFLSLQEAFDAGKVPESAYLQAYSKVDEWEPETALDFTRKALCLLGDGGLPNRDVMDRLMADARRLVSAAVDR